MKSAGKARNNGLFRHIRTSKEIIRNLLNDYLKNKKQTLHLTEVCQKKILLLHRIFMEDIPVQPVMPVFTGVPRMLPCLKFHF